VSHIDAYTIKARIAPAIVVVLPLISVALVWFPKLLSLPGLSALGTAGVALVVIVAWQTRRAGKQLQEELKREWGAMPTTIVLRHSDDTFTESQKARYHAMLQERVPGISIPDAQAEARDPAEADRNYAMATDWLREQTRDNPVVSSENATYGFFRNLCALRGQGLASSAVGIIASGAAIALDKAPATPETAAVVSLGISLVCVAVMFLHATRRHVETASREYAVALIRSVDGTARPH
jgi:hypothetical protein